MSANGTWGTIKIAASDCNTVAEANWNRWYLKTNHLGEYNGITKINTHTYSGTWSEKDQLRKDVSTDGKQLWQSETGPLNISDWQKSHYIMLYRQIEDLRNLRCDVWCDWQLVSTDAGWGMFKFDINNQTYEKTKAYYTRSHINRFIPQGYQIIGSSNGCFIAARDPGNTKVVIVVANQDDYNKSYTIDLSKFTYAKSYVMYRTTGQYTYEGENLKSFSSTAITNKKFNYTAPGRSATTFVVTTTALGKADGEEVSTDENIQSEETKNIPSEFSLKQNYPNPFNPSTAINYDIPENGNVSLQVYDVQGSLVESLVNDYQEAGTYTVNWNASSLNLPSGIYYARLISGSKMNVIKMMLVK